MTTPSYRGGCACGAVRYEVRAATIGQNHCQCRDCRQRSGTGHGSYLAFAPDAGMKITGEARAWRITADSGNDKFHAFCPTCGTPVYLTFAAMPGLVAIHAGSLDEPAGFTPDFVTYAERSLPWDAMPATLPAFARMPSG